MKTSSLTVFHRYHNKIKSLFIYIAVIITMIWTLAPFGWLIMSSVRTRADLLSIPLRWIPERVTLENYVKLIMDKEVKSKSLYTGVEGKKSVRFFRQALLNSFIVASTVTILCLAIGSLAAYSFIRYSSSEINFTLFLYLFLRVFPSITILIPIYILLKNLSLLNTHLGLIIAYMPFQLILAILILKSYFQSIPREIEESAKIDGCSTIGIILKIILPLSAPGLVAAGTVTFIGCWGEFLYALNLTNNYFAKTITVAIPEFNDQFTLNYSLICTGGVIAVLPPIILAIVFQRFIISGLTSGAGK